MQTRSLAAVARRAALPVRGVVRLRSGQALAGNRRGEAPRRRSQAIFGGYRKDMKKKRIVWAIIGYAALFLLLTYAGFVFDLALQGL